MLGVGAQGGTELCCRLVSAELSECVQSSQLFCLMIWVVVFSVLWAQAGGFFPLAIINLGHPSEFFCLHGFIASTGSIVFYHSGNFSVQTLQNTWVLNVEKMDS